MQVSVEKTSELSRKMTISVPESVVQEKISARFKSLAGKVKVDGFRPGKVPQKVVQKMYGGQVREEVQGELIQSTYFDALKEQELHPAGFPAIDVVSSEPDFIFTAVFEVYPEVSLAAVTEVTVNKSVATVADADVDAMIDKLKQQQKTWQETDQVSQQGDRLTIKFSGSCEGENFTDGQVEDFSVEIGSKRMIAGFEDALVGLAAGATKTFNVTFPEGYGNDKLAGKEAEFDIEVQKVETSVVPELDAAFIEAYGIDSGNVDDFRADVRANLERELETALKNRLKNAVMDALSEKIEVTVPTSLVDQEVESMMKPYRDSAKKQNKTLNDMELPRDEFEKQAVRRVKLGLILGEIIKQNEIKVDDAKVRNAVESMSKSYEQPEEFVNWYYADKQRLADVEQMVLEDETVEWVLGQVQVADEAVSFADVMDAAAQSR